MKSIKTCIVIAALCSMAPAFAQKTFGSDKYSAMCNYYGEAVSSTIVMNDASPTAENVVRNIMSVIGLHANFELRASSDIPTAAAVIRKGKRYILYNPNFMNKINGASGSNWAAISILAHEIGHHLNGHTLDNIGSKPGTELEADEFSGFVLQKMGASLSDAQAAMALIASHKGSHSHPPKNQRLTAIAAGFNKAGGTASNSTAVAVNKPKTTETKPVHKPVASKPVKKPQTKREKIQQSILSDQYIASDAYFSTNPDGQYFITVRGNFVMVDDDNVYLLGSLAPSDKRGYKLMLAGENNNIYIDPRGGLVNHSGKRVGYLKARQ